MVLTARVAFPPVEEMVGRCAQWRGAPGKSHILRALVSSVNTRKPFKWSSSGLKLSMPLQISLTKSNSGTGNDLKNTYLLQEKCIFIVLL